MPKTTYSQCSLNNQETFLDHYSVKKTKRKSRIHKKKFKPHYNSTKFQNNKYGKKSTTILRYKSAFSPLYTIQIHDIEMSSFHSDEIGPRCPHSQDQIQFKEIETIPFADQCSQQTYRRFCQDFQRRDLERIMRACKVTNEGEEKIVD